MGNISLTVANIRPLQPALVTQGKAGAAISAAVGKVVSRDANGDWVEALATTAANAHGQLGIIVATGRHESSGDALSGEAVSVLLEGRVFGFESLDPDNYYYLSDTAGKVSDTVGTIHRFLAYAEDSTVLYFAPEVEAASV